MKTAEEIPSETVTKMQKEFQPRTETSFEQGMYSGYAFGLQDGFKYALEQYRTEGLREEHKCKSCGEPLSEYCDRCQHLWET